MNRDTFAEWLAYHRDAFPAVRPYLRDNAGTLTHWASAVEAFELPELKRATDALVRGEEHAYGPQDHITAICRIVRDRRQRNARTGPRRIDGRDTYRCGRCRDSGVVLIYDPALSERIADNEFEHEETPWAGVRKYNVACSCFEGRRWSEDSPNRRTRLLPVFQSAKHFEVGPKISRESWEDFVAWSIERENAKREPAFDAWNQGEL